MALYLKQLPLGPMENFVYLIGDSVVKKCWIVDPAWEIEKAWDTATQDGYTIEGALITHGHFDHCNAVEKLLAQKNVPVYVNPHETDYIDHGAPRGLFLDLPKDQMKPVRGGDKISLGSMELTFLHTPGHTPGSQCFLINGNLVAGDTLFLGTCGRCDLPGSDPVQMHHSLHNVLGKLPPETVLFPGHNYSSRGTQSTLGEEQEKNRFLSAPTLADFLKRMGQ